jgi:hypothetical protein
MTDRRTGSVGVTVDLDRRSDFTLNRQTGAVGVNVDLDRRGDFTLNRQTGSVGVTVDLKTLPPAIELGGSVSQATAVDLILIVISGGDTYELAVSASQATGVLLRLQPFYQALATSQGTAATLEVYRLPTSLPLTVETTQSTSVSVALQRQLARTLATLTQAQSVSLATTDIKRLIVTATQGMTVTLQKMIAIRRATTGNRRVQTIVKLSRQPQRTRSVTQGTAVRLIKQVQRTLPTISQSTSVSLAGLPVQLEVLSVVQTRSLDLGRVITLMRSVVQSTAAYLVGGSELAPLVVQPTVLSRQQAIDLTRTIEQAQAVSLEALNVTPRYDILVTASVSQAVALGMSDTGAPARRFVVDTRHAEFVVGQRGNGFVVPGRRARFRVEVR